MRRVQFDVSIGMPDEETLEPSNYAAYYCGVLQGLLDKYLRDVTVTVSPPKATNGS